MSGSGRGSEIIRRYINIEQTSVSLSTVPFAHEGLSPLKVVKLAGAMNEPLGKGVVDVDVSIHRDRPGPDTRDGSPHLGALIRLKPSAQFVITADDPLFTQVLMLAAANAIVEASIALKVPRYGTGKIVAWDVSIKSDWFAENEAASG